MGVFNISDVVTSTSFLFIAVGLYRYILYPVILSPLTKIPSAHWSSSFSSAWILWARFRGRENKTICEAHRKFGPVVRLGPSEVSINNVEAVKTVYQGGFDKHVWYSVFDNYGVPNVFSSSPAKHHSLRKRMVSHVYSNSYLFSSQSLAAQAEVIIGSRLLPAIAVSAAENQDPHGMNVYSLFRATATDLISAFCFGLRNSSNFIENKSYRDHWIKLYEVRAGYGFFYQELPRLSRALSRIGIRLTPTWVDAANKELEAWCFTMCKKATGFLRKTGTTSQGSADDPVVVRALLAGVEKEEMTRGKASPIYETTILQQELSVASEIIDHVLAGQETTGVVLTYLSWHLSQSQELQRELRAELLTLEPNVQLRQGKISLPDAKQLDSLPLLQAVVTETIRRYNAAGGPEPRVVPQPSCHVGPYDIPGGIRISASAYNLHRDEKYFPDPDVWDHRRWLQGQGGDGKSRKDRNRQFWGFSSGGRMCLGSNFALHEMKLLIAAIYTNYTTHIVNDEGIEPTDGYTAHPTSGQLWLRFQKVE
ncbi:cytochrome P450 [Xylariales sp. PMI_506]|nr:cytochrome P450 [Xylariales sp. PMI_506]